VNFVTENIEKPSSLVRFYGNPEHAINCIKSNKISFGSVDNFNDPFDPVREVYLEDTDGFKNWVKNNKPQYSHKVKDHTAQHFINTANLTLKESIRNPYAISFSECNEKIKHSMYMWSHYANGHKGVAIEFDFDLLRKKFTKFLCQMTYKESIKKISHNMLLDIFLKKEKNQYIETALDNFSIKSTDWIQEEEWRIYTKDNKYEARIECDILSETIKSIYIGCISETYKVENSIKNVLEEVKIAVSAKQPNAKIYQAKKDLRNLAITFEEIGN
jgi:hypothetical protein